jgi:hypothetical protein
VIAILASLPFFVFAWMMIRAEWKLAPDDTGAPVVDPKSPAVGGWVAPPPWAYSHQRESGVQTRGW